MNFYFLPIDLRAALDNLNMNFVNEIRLRAGQPVIIQYRGEYMYINKYGVSAKRDTALFCENAEQVLNAAMEGCVYAYTEQLKNGYITVDGGVRIGIAGEYVTEGGSVVAVKNVTSLNIRIPHEAKGCADELFSALLESDVRNLIIFSLPGFGKTTLLRQIAAKFSTEKLLNVLILDSRGEISAMGPSLFGFDLGERCDVIRGGEKLLSVANAIRALKPQVIITDEIYGPQDIEAIEYANDCAIPIIASTHITDKNVLKRLPFTYYIELTGIGKSAVGYDKAFNIIGHYNTFCRAGDSAV